MNSFIIIRGPLGCGKTTVAKHLAKILKAECISFDEILEEYGLDKVSPEADCIPAKNFIKANKIILPESKKNLANGKTVIFDACFYHKEPLEHLIHNLSHPHYVFTLKAPVEVCIARDKKREKTHGEDAARAVHYLVSRFNYGTIIDVTRSLEKVIKEILSHLSLMDSFRVIPVAGCAIIQKGKILLLYKKSHLHYEFPGGKVKVGETLRHAAIRETKEEIGCAVRLGRYFGFSHLRDKHPRYHYKAHVFLATLVGKKNPKVMDHDDFRDMRWISFSQTEKFPLAENVKVFLKKFTGIS